ncbi:hypothetical protein JF531_07590 [Microbacterium esteraromaticum]|uniref:hypothetical protein n=1 Tax=Microbacterium esteraromaticum TaxID=57043 RepID=UPI001A8E4DCC|nr:hypothetical protein [Microbacterium esteraromaticum]MBN8424382.1 hypothetical protein [Microbacterium esteraromaticum]
MMQLNGAFEEWRWRIDETGRAGAADRYADIHGTSELATYNTRLEKLREES